MSDRFAQCRRPSAGPAARRRTPRASPRCSTSSCSPSPSPDIGGNWRTTTFGSALDDWQSFARTLLNGLTFAGLLLRRGERLHADLRPDARRQHGARLVLPARRLHRLRGAAADDGCRAHSIAGTEVNTWDGCSRRLVAAAVIGVVGLIIQQVFLRWNQGQDLRQALITIAISVIIADQMLAHFGEGIASSVTWPGWTNRLVDAAAARDRLLGRAARRPRARARGRPRALAVALPHPHGDGDPRRRRRPPDDLGARHQHPAHLRDRLRRRLRRWRRSAAVVGGSQGAVAAGQDGQWLLNSLIVVIIGGMGSLGRRRDRLAALRARGLVRGRLPADGRQQRCTQYSIVFTFVLLAVVLAVRPLGLFGRSRDA